MPELKTLDLMGSYSSGEAQSAMADMMDAILDMTKLLSMEDWEIERFIRQEASFLRTISENPVQESGPGSKLMSAVRERLGSNR